MAHSFSPSDLAQLEAKGISIEKAEKQLQSFATGFPELDIVSAASVGNGVLTPSEEEMQQNPRSRSAKLRIARKKRSKDELIRK